MAGIIIVGIDGSETAAAAADAAARLASGLGADLHVVCAYSPRPSEEITVGSDTWHFNVVDEALSMAEKEALRFADMPIEVTAGAIEGKPGDALIAEAERLGATMIVVGNRRMHGIARLLGSVANDVAHHAPCDVYIVKTV